MFCQSGLWNKQFKPRVAQGFSVVKQYGAGNYAYYNLPAAPVCTLTDVYSNSSEAHCAVYVIGNDVNGVPLWRLDATTTESSAYKRCGATCFN